MMVNPASRELVTPQRLRAFFAPKSIALVGASDNSGWASEAEVRAGYEKVRAAATPCRRPTSMACW